MLHRLLAWREPAAQHHPAGSHVPPSCTEGQPTCLEIPLPPSGPYTLVQTCPHTAAARGQRHPSGDGDSSCLPAPSAGITVAGGSGRAGPVPGRDGSTAPGTVPAPLRNKTFDSCIKQSRFLTFGTIYISHAWSLAVKKKKKKTVEMYCLSPQRQR